VLRNKCRLFRFKRRVLVNKRRVFRCKRHVMTNKCREIRVSSRGFSALLGKMRVILITVGQMCAARQMIDLGIFPKRPRRGWLHRQSFGPLRCVPKRQRQNEFGSWQMGK
jgi:hypothetical protein